MVYVDNARTPYRGMKMCHMWSDNDGELETMARRLQMKPEWKHNDHYDICLSKRVVAVRYGAAQVTTRQLAELRARHRRTQS